jgi:hypothetical protein
MRIFLTLFFFLLFFDYSLKIPFILFIIFEKNPLLLD